MSQFNPNATTFEDGVKRVRDAIAKAGVSLGNRILTSRDPEAKKLTRALTVKNVPPGFQKWQLPVVLDRAQLYVTVASPGAKAPEHSHDEGDGVRFIISGSIHYDGVELTAGDWMYIPKGARYSFQAGDMGAIICYCYACSCA